MFGQVVLQDVSADIDVGPVCNRVEFEAALLDFKNGDVFARCRLLAAQPRVPAAHAQFVQRTLHRFHFAQLVVAGDAIAAGFPQLAQTRFHPRIADASVIDVQLQAEQFSQLVGIAIGFRKQIAGIDHDHRQAGRCSCK